MTAPTSLHPAMGGKGQDTGWGCQMRDQGPVCESHVKFVHRSIYVCVYTWRVYDEPINQAVCVASFLCARFPDLPRVTFTSTFCFCGLF